jgi:predicted lactoylglutathione lyase
MSNMNPTKVSISLSDKTPVVLLRQVRYKTLTDKQLYCKTKYTTNDTYL